MTERSAAVLPVVIAPPRRPPVAAAVPRRAPKRIPPARLIIPAGGINVPVRPVGVDGERRMQLIGDPAVAGWYRFGPAPGSAEGSVVIAAHVDAPGFPIGPLSTLRDRGAGDTVVLTDRSGARWRYMIRSVVQHPKEDLQTEVLFARTGPRRLVLITCGGDFDRDRMRYSDNVVAIATPLSR